MADPPRKRTPVSGAARRARVLVVDDDADIAKSLKRYLAAEHDVEVAADGAEALARLDGGERFDVIISDLMMPNVSGEQLYRVLEARDPDVARALVFVTAGGLSSEARALLDEVDNLRFEKPVDPRVLLDTIRRRLAGPSRE